MFLFMVNGIVKGSDFTCIMSTVGGGIVSTVGVGWISLYASCWSRKMSFAAAFCLAFCLDTPLAVAESSERVAVIV